MKRCLPPLNPCPLPPPNAHQAEQRRRISLITRGCTRSHKKSATLALFILSTIVLIILFAIIAAIIWCPPPLSAWCPPSLPSSIIIIIIILIIIIFEQFPLLGILQHRRGQPHFHRKAACCGHVWKLTQIGDWILSDALCWNTYIKLFLEVCRGTSELFFHPPQFLEWSLPYWWDL